MPDDTGEGPNFSQETDTAEKDQENISKEASPTGRMDTVGKSKFAFSFTLGHLCSKTAHFKRAWRILKVLSRPCPLGSK